MEKSKVTLISEASKVHENKVALIISIFVQGLKDFFSNFCQPRQLGAILEFKRNKLGQRQSQTPFSSAF